MLPYSGASEVCKTEGQIRPLKYIPLFVNGVHPLRFNPVIDKATTLCNIRVARKLY
jgi:hypothetical protein